MKTEFFDDIPTNQKEKKKHHNLIFKNASHILFGTI